MIVSCQEKNTLQYILNYVEFNSRNVWNVFVGVEKNSWKEKCDDAPISLSLSHSLTHTLSLSHSLTHSHTHSLSLSLTHTHIHSRSCFACVVCCSILIWNWKSIWKAFCCKLRECQENKFWSLFDFWSTIDRPDEEYQSIKWNKRKNCSLNLRFVKLILSKCFIIFFVVVQNPKMLPRGPIYVEVLMADLLVQGTLNRGSVGIQMKYTFLRVLIVSWYYEKKIFWFERNDLF